MSVIGELLTDLGLAAAPGQATPRPPAALPGAWLGIDRGYLPGAPAHPDLDWMRLLPAHSNLRFCGAYLEGDSTSYPPGWNAAGVPVNPATGSPFTASSINTRRGWMQNVSVLRAQGWGTVFVYFGYSVGGAEPISKTNATPGQYAALGTLDAQHAKLIMHAVSPQLDGAVVYVDNEDVNPAPAVGDPIMGYYQAFLSELQRPGPGTGVPAMRAGAYAYWRAAPAFIATQPGLFWWQDGEKPQQLCPAPGGLGTDPVHLDPSLPGRGAAAARAAVGRPYARAVANQFFEYPPVMPDAGSPAATQLVTAAAPQGTYADWDYSASFVRDPAYPAAEPRLAVAGGNPAGPVVAEGFYTPATPGYTPGDAGTGNPPQMTVDVLTTTASAPADRTPVPLPAGLYLEPEAPLRWASAPVADAGTAAANYVASLVTPPPAATGATGNADFAVFDDTTYTWTATGMAVAPRRLRTLALAASAPDELELYYAGYDPSDAGQFLLCGMQRAGGTWTAPAPLGGDLGVHPFADLAAVVRAGVSVDTFTISWTAGGPGVLTQVSWPLGSSWPPTAAAAALEAGPSVFLPGTRLAAVSPDPSTVVVVGVGTDQQLRYVTIPAAGAAEATLTVLGTGSGTDFVLPQTALATTVAGQAIMVAAFSDTGPVRLYQLDTLASPWTVTTTLLAGPPQLPPAAPPGASDLTAPASQWHPNPWGDLAFGQQDGIQYLYAAGLNPAYASPVTGTAGERTALLRYALADGPWLVYQR